MRFLKNLKIELPYDPAIPLLGVYPGELKAGIGTDTNTQFSLWHYLQLLKDRNNPSVYQQMMDKQSVDKQMWSMIQWDINQPGKGIKY